MITVKCLFKYKCLFQIFKFLKLEKTNTWRIDAKTSRVEAFFKALDLSVCKNLFIGSTKISQRTAVSSSVQFLTLAAFFFFFFWLFRRLFSVNGRYELFQQKADRHMCFPLNRWNFPSKFSKLFVNKTFDSI